MTAIGITLCVAGGLLIVVGLVGIEYVVRIMGGLAERESELDRAYHLREESLEERYAEERRMWAEERRSLLDRIQFPLARGMELMPPGDLPEGQSDQEVDEKWLEDERSRVEWDPDLQGFGSDAELAVPEQVAD